MGRGQSAKWTADVVRSNRHAMYVGELRNVLSNGQSTDFLKIRSHNAERMLRDDFLKAFEQEQIFSGGNRDTHFQADFFQRSSVVWRNRILKPQQPEWFKFPRHFHDTAS